MLARHPDTESLQRFIRGESTSTESREVVAHLLSGCEQCRAISSEEWSSASAAPVRSRACGPGSSDFEARREALHAHRQGTGDLWSRLEPLPHSRRRVVVRNSRRYQTLGLCELLMDMAFELGFDDPAAALPLSELAVDVAESLDVDTLGEGLVNDYRARALGYRANALRINADFRVAESLLLQAEDLLETGSGDVLEQALLLRFKAYLSGDRGDFDEAIRFIRRAVRLYRRVGDRALANRVSITLGAYLGQNDRPQDAVRVLRRTLSELDPDDSRLVLGCRHNLALNLKNSGHIDEALRVLQESRKLYAEVGDRVMLLKLQGMEGKIARDLGNPALAERAFKGACRGYEELGLPFSAADVGLALADLYLEQGRMTEVLALSGKLFKVFETLDTPREALAAMELFHRAAEREVVTEAVLRDVRSLLKGLKVR